MYQIYNDEDEFEPRVTPKPASKPDCFMIPSVPEVSLIFDKPLSYKSTQHIGFPSPSVESKNLIYKSNGSSSLNVNGSYAAWKEQNYSWKPSSSKDNACTTPQKVQSNKNYIIHSYSTENTNANTLKKSKERNYSWRKDICNDSQYEQEIHRKNDHFCGKYNSETCGNNTTHTEKNQSIRTQCNNKVRHVDSVSNISHVAKPYLNTENYIVNENEYSSLMYERKLTAHNAKQQKVSCNDSVTNPNVQDLSINPSTVQTNEVHLPHYLGQQYPYFNMNTYPFSQLHSYSTQNTDNQDTVKNLLQIINSQNEQIKSLQTQVDRLLKMQEESLKERKKCFCVFQSKQQSNESHTSVKTNDIPGVSNYVTVPENINTGVHQRKCLGEKEKENNNENINQDEVILTDARSKTTFLEQKVSIGVMTSFEFTVQNSPVTMDIEDYEKKNSQQKQENLKMCNSVGLRDNNESLRRYKNSFTRMPSAQLENIVEDSESYMSSSQQQSSNLNGSTSTKDLEKQVITDTKRDSHRSVSPKLCQSTAKQLNDTENSIKKPLDKTCTEEAKNYETMKIPTIQKNVMNIEYNVPKNRNFEANAFTNMDQYKKPNIQQNHDFVKTNSSVNNELLDYYKDYQKERQIIKSKRNHHIEDSLILNGGDLKINERPPPTPEPSIHVEMHEYSSDDDSEKVKRSSKVGWTFYNNVLGQVNQLLQNSCVIDDQQQNQTKVNQNERDETENKAVLDTVKVATLEQLKKLGISLSENPDTKELNNSHKMAFDLSFYPRLDYQTNTTQATSAVNETNTSIHMKALALKYLTDEQLAELAVQRQGSTSVKHLMVSNVQGTNMSFATMRYLERYQLLPGKNNVQTEDISKIQAEVSPKVDFKFTNPKSNPKALRFPFNQTPRTTCPSKILDISTLKQQPKLL